jgi:hypothetical protein
MEKLAWLLDGAIPVPGTKFRFGLDSIIGLIPGVGDAIGLLLGAGILYESVRIGVPRPLLVKMVGNAALDTLGGLVPGIGDLFDFAFRSNARNAKLLMQHLDALDAASRPVPAPASRGQRLLTLLLLAGFVVGAVALFVWIWGRVLG